MTWLDPVRWPIAAALLAALPAAAFAQAMVVRSSGPSAPQYPTGRKLAADARLSLASGDLVVLLDGEGTRTLRGPGSFAVADRAGGASASGGLVALLTAGRPPRARTGAVRAPDPSGPAPQRPNLWFADVARGGRLCTPDPAALVLWRADIAGTARLRLTAGGQTAEVTMREGEATATPPAGWALADGARITIERAEVAPIALELVKIPTPPAEAQEVAALLIAQGCDAQLDTLIAAMPAR